ncbi:MAG: EI24 domain-containing protein [Sphingomonas sp.]
MFRAFFLSLSQLGDPRIVRVFLKSFLITLVVFAVIGVGVWYGVDALMAQWDIGDSSPWLAGLAAIFGTVLLGWLLFQVVAIGVIQLFVDDIVLAVEQRHYPDALAGARRITMGRAALMGLGSAGRALLVNLALLPLYLLLLVTGVGTLVLFLVANGWVLGRDLMEMVAARHLPRAAMRDWRKTTRGERFALGVAIMALFVVPFANLFAPVLGAAMATHLFHGRRK